MSTFDRVLQLKLVTDVGNMSKEVKTATKGVSGLTTKVKGMGRALGGALKLGAISYAIEGIKALSDAIGGGMADARQTEETMRNLSGTLRTLGLDSAKTSASVEKLANTAVDLGFDDDEAVRGFDEFVKRTKSVSKSQKLMAAAMDLSRSKGIPLGKAITEVSALFEGQGRALNRYGLKGVRGMRAVNRAMKTSKGKAKEWADANGNKFDVLKGKAGELFEALGASVNSIVDTAIPIITDTLIPAIGSIWDDTQPKLQELGAEMGPKLAEILGKAGALWDELLPHIQDLADAAGPLLDAMSENVGRIMDAIGLALDTVIALVNGDWTLAWEDFQALLSTVLDIFLAPLQGLQEALQPFEDDAFVALQAIGDQAWAGLTEGLSGLADLAGDAIQDGLDALPGLAAEAFTAAVDIGGKLLSGLQEGAATLLPVAKQLIQDIIDALPGLAADMLAGALELGDNILEGLETGAELLLPIARQLIQDIIDALPGLAADMLAGAGALGLAILDGMEAGALGLLEAGKGLVQAIIDALPGLAATMLTAATAIGKAILDGIIAGAPGMLELGTTLIQGLVDGIAGMGEATLAAATDIGGKIVSGILDAMAGLAGDMADAVRSAINGVIGLWNGMTLPGASVHIDGFSIDVLGQHQQVINAQDFQLWPSVGFPNIKPLATGGVVVRPTVALVGEAGPEAVIPLGRAGLGGDTFNINVTVGPTADPYQVGQAIVRAIRSFESREGKGWRAA